MITSRIGLYSFLVVFLFHVILPAQHSQAVNLKTYQINQKLEASLSAGLIALNLIGLMTLKEKATLSVAKVNALNKSDIWAFDRSALNQSYPAPENIYDLTDIGLYGSSAMASLLFLDEDIREDWLDISLLFIETQAINLNIYFWGGPAFTKRIRPIVYYREASLETKTGKDMTDSFFSGHVSLTAGAAFFMAKVYSDYHPELGAKKWLFYSAALIPPALVGYGRFRGLMHFPSDILLGFTIGATVGVLVPHLHKIKKPDKSNLSFIPFVGQYNGLSAVWHF